MRPKMRIAFVVLLLASAAVLALDLEPSSASHAATTRPRSLALAKPKPRPSTDTISVAFFRRGRLVRVQRTLANGARPEWQAIRALLSGPTLAERRKGIKSVLPARARARSLRPDPATDGWRLNLSRSTFAGGTPETKRRRLVQIDATLAGMTDASWLTLASEGRFLMVQNLSVRPGPWRAEPGEKRYLYSLRGVQVRLWQLGYLDRASITGEPDYLTEQALLAFQGWERLGRTATVTGETQRALLRADRPRAAYRFSGRHVEIFRDIGVALLVEDGEVARAVHTSTGSFGRTPAGDFHVYAKSLYSWSVPFHVWMPYASYFNGGIAMHEYPDVPSYPASHGCVRLPAGEAQRVYGFVSVGTPVFVR